MTNQQLATKLVRTLSSIRNHTKRGGSLNSVRGQLLVDRYNGLKSATLHQSERTWLTYCNEIGACFTHDGYDLFA